MARHWAPLKDPNNPETRSRSINTVGTTSDQWGQRPLFSEPGNDQPPPEQGSLGTEGRPDDIYPSDRRAGSNATEDLVKADAIQPVPFHVINHAVSNPPTDAQIRAALGTSNLLGNAFIIRDGAGAGVLWLIVRGGSDTYWYEGLTKAT